jgi:amidase
MNERFVGRRDFLRTGAVAVVATAAVRAVPAEAGPVAAAEAAPAGGFEFAELTIDTLQERMKSGALTSRQLTSAYLERIAALDRQGPSLHAILETNPEALAIAEALDAERKAKGPRGPMHGIPVLLKDNIDTADRMTTTAGSLALEGSIPLRDAFIAERLRAAGAVLLGKTNMSEWANIRSSRSSSGWSGRGGQARMPYALDRNASGSSSGTGIAVSANLASVGVGTETDGSIVSPSNNCGLVGVKPTLGLLSRAGIIPIAHSQDTPGPMARTVRDAAILLGAMAGVDPRDAETAGSRGHATADYAAGLDAKGLKGMRLGVVRKQFGFHPAVDRAMEAALDAMKREGAVLVDPVDIPHVGEYDASEFEVLLYELKTDLNAYLAGLGPSARVRTLADVIRFNEENKDREMPYFGQEVFLQAQEKGPLTTPAYLEALEKNRRLSRKEGLDAVLDEHKLDALVAPTGGPAWLIDLVTSDHFGGGNTTPAAVAGYPHVTVPVGATFGLPFGISFLGRAWSEPALLKIAYAFEQATHHRRAPELLPTVKLV